MKFLSGLLALLCVLQVHAQNAFESWLPDHSSPIDSPANWAWIQQGLAQARVIGLGEATHNTHEFFQFKDRLFRHLVNEEGVRIFALEAGFSECESINAYLQAGIGSPESALAATGMWVWQTEEMADMLRWMRTFNEAQSPDKRIRFYGIDMQGNVYPASFLRNFFLDHDTSLVERFGYVLRELSQRELYVPEGKEREFLKELDSLQTYLQQRAPLYRQQMGETEIALVQQHARVLSQAVRQYTGGLERLWRDRCMAENVHWVLKQHGPEEKVVVWAHNGHIQRRHNALGGKLMGTHLAETYGPAYYALGFDFGEGEFQAFTLQHRDRRLFNVELPPDGHPYWRALMAQPGPATWVDLRAAHSDRSVLRFLKKQSTLRSVGAVYFPDHNVRTYPVTEAFDGLVFFKKTKSARLLASNLRQQVVILQRNIPIPKSWRKKKLKIEVETRGLAIDPRMQVGFYATGLDRKEKVRFKQPTNLEGKLNGETQTGTLELVLKKGIVDLELVLFLRGEGSLTLESVEISLAKDGEWIPQQLDNLEFEEGTLPPWKVTGGESKWYELVPADKRGLLRIGLGNRVTPLPGGEQH